MLKKTSSIVIWVICLAMSLCMALPSVAAAAPSHMSHPAPKKMLISAPSKAQAGQEVTVRITNMRDESPVEGASVYLVPRHEPSYLPLGQNYTPPALTPRSLGTTGADGELKVTLTDPGKFFLTAEKPGFAQGFAAVTVYKAQQEVTFTADKQVYNQAEPVTLTLRNGLDSPITLNCGAPWKITRPNGESVFAPFSIMVIIDVEPGKEITWAWDQKDQAGEQVKPGVYVATIRTSGGDIFARFCITGLRTGKDIRNPDPKMPEDRPFTDVTGKHLWGDPHVLHLHQKGIVRGKSAGAFDPEGTLTRAEFVAMLLRACGLESQTDEDGNSEESEDPFPDITPAHWAYAHIRKAREMGILTDDEYWEGFGPDAPITRMEICVMAARALGLEGEACQNAGEMAGFDDDDDIALAYRGYVKAAVEWGVLKGYPDATFRPWDNATRREAAVIIYRLMQLELED